MIRKIGLVSGVTGALILGVASPASAGTLDQQQTGSDYRRRSVHEPERRSDLYGGPQWGSGPSRSVAVQDRPHAQSGHRRDTQRVRRQTRYHGARKRHHPDLRRSQPLRRPSYRSLSRRPRPLRQARSTRSSPTRSQGSTPWGGATRTPRTCTQQARCSSATRPSPRWTTWNDTGGRRFRVQDLCRACPSCPPKPTHEHGAARQEEVQEEAQDAPATRQEVQEEAALATAPSYSATAAACRDSRPAERSTCCRRDR